jgi:hypothetical protein
MTGLVPVISIDLAKQRLGIGIAGTSPAMTHHSDDDSLLTTTETKLQLGRRTA